jgi:transposase
MKRQKYTSEFRAEATKLVTEQGLSQETAAKRLSISSREITNHTLPARRQCGHMAQPKATLINCDSIDHTFRL